MLSNENQNITKSRPIAKTEDSSIDRIDALDLVNVRHQQVQAILSSLFICFNDADPAQKTFKNMIWAALDLLEQTEDAVAMLGICERVGTACATTQK